MLLVVILLTIIFLIISFVGNSSPIPTDNYLYKYSLSQINFMMKDVRVFIFAFFILSFVFFRFNFDKKYHFLKIYFFSLLQTIVAVITGFLSAFILLFVIAFLQLNIFALLINVNPKIVGVENDKKTIIEKLENNKQAIEIITSENNQKRVLIAIAKATAGVNNFYGTSVLSTIPGFLILPLNQPNSNLLLIDNKLIMTQITPEDMTNISPLIGYVFLKSYFPLRQIKHYPKVEIMNRDEYAAYRKNETKKKIEKVDLQIKKIDSYVSSISAAITNNKKLDTRENKKILSDYKYYEDFYKKQKNVLEIQSEKVPHENGLFVPENSIKLVFNSSDIHGVADYFATVVHEYLHYASFVSSEKRFENSFFEEGLTEYFARNAIKESLDTSTNLGYPVQVKIIKEMTNMITESELADLYFAKDEEGLERALDRVYGDDFYKNNSVLFETLQFSSDSKQTLKLANEIMQKIGGEPLKEKDLYSSYSRL